MKNNFNTRKTGVKYGPKHDKVNSQRVEQIVLAVSVDMLKVLLTGLNSLGKFNKQLGVFEPGKFTVR